MDDSEPNMNDLNEYEIENLELHSDREAGNDDNKKRLAESNVVNKEGSVGNDSDRRRFSSIKWRRGKEKVRMNLYASKFYKLEIWDNLGHPSIFLENWVQIQI